MKEILPVQTPRMNAVRQTLPLSGRRILIIVENLPLPFDRRVWHECRTLRAAGAEVSVICPTGKGYGARYEEIDGVHIYRHSLPLDASGALGYLLEYGMALFHEMRLALKVARRQGFDTIQACNPPDLIFLVALPFKLFGKRFIFDHHDINPELYEAKFGRRGFFWRLMVLFERWTFRTADVVISTNESYREIAMERGGVAAEDVFIVRSGPDLSRLVVTAPNPDWHNGRAHMVGYVGVMGDQEGIDLLLEAARIIVQDRGRDVQFVLVGGGPALQGLRTLADDLGLQDHVTFTGRAPDAELFEVLSSADVCVNPDRVNPMNDKSTMNKIMEYMAFSKPIVQFDVTEGRHSAGRASLYAAANDTSDMANKILELLDDPALAAEMGAFGRNRVETELNWDHQVDALVDAYRRVIVKKPL
ncbi:glycosyltransferase family 4 protein [Pseudohalocynthiibacter sp. F2068]|jgi:glycosyltransferase involved in cell wall biosynthesis|uniref:glycosyltransferase family 4 protein n=1 Tax=Pseudohalocynthiibacter sp. F2068 TaxID=2926418 RepID=UPI001FF44CCE|nr:glycosyltransferase family 4 protein [Pseudohalocynthiibacter sp. F2068]MCK0103915.1 glycosyltransferase family 4 protein [Pseudohalocynthiibacter sp. F2068]